MRPVEGSDNEGDVAMRPPGGDADGDDGLVGGLRFPFAKRPESTADKEAREAREAATAAEKAAREAEEAAAKAADKEAREAEEAAAAAEKAAREAEEAAAKAAMEEAKRQREIAAENRARARATGNKAALIEGALVKGEESWSNLRDAIETGKIHSSEVQEVLSSILRALAKGSEEMSQYKTSETILTKFIRDGGGDTVKVDVNFRGPFGETALMQAAVNGRSKHVEDLIKAKADVNVQNANGETALMWAAAYDEVDVINVLLKNKADPNLKDELGWTALMVAAWAGSLKAIGVLKPKSDINATNAEGLRARNLAASRLSPGVARGKQKEITYAFNTSSLLTRRKKGGKHKTQRRKKTNSKKRNRR
jgi:hypothetical protein